MKGDDKQPFGTAVKSSRKVDKLVKDIALGNATITRMQGIRLIITNLFYL